MRERTAQGREVRQRSIWRAVAWLCLLSFGLLCAPSVGCDTRRVEPDGTAQQDSGQGQDQQVADQVGGTDATQTEPTSQQDLPAPTEQAADSAPEQPSGQDQATPPEGPATEQAPPENATSDQCQPTTCAAQKKDCDMISDGCGRQIPCGTCQGTATCGGGGVPNVCGVPPQDLCKAIRDNPNWELCGQTATSCTAVFNDSAGCASVCAAVGMVCSEVYEDAPGCKQDTSRPALTCGGTGHQSDWCKCVKSSSCQPACQGKKCGDDGCNGSCGSCATGESCVAGQCQKGNVQEDCTKYPFQSSTLLAERVGFGAKATGGNPSVVYRVKTLSDSGAGSLRTGLESSTSHWIVFDVNGTIKLSKEIDIKPNKTVDGRGRDITIEGQLSIGPGVKNVIISDIAITNPKNDAIEIRGDIKDSKGALSTRDFWLHHLELYKSNDGLIDVWHAATDITISWNYLHDHAKAILVGADSNYAALDAGIRMTFHHNYFYRVTRRQPRFRYGIADYFNNYVRDWWEYGAGSFSGAQMLSENNIYEARPGQYCFTPCPDPNTGDTDFTISKQALINDWASQGLGFTRSVGDLLLNDAKLVIHQPNNVFQRATYYNATPDKADNALKQRLLTEAGPRRKYCKP